MHDHFSELQQIRHEFPNPRHWLQKNFPSFRIAGQADALQSPQRPQLGAVLIVIGGGGGACPGLLVLRTASALRELAPEKHSRPHLLREEISPVQMLPSLSGTSASAVKHSTQPSVTSDGGAHGSFSQNSCR